MDAENYDAARRPPRRSHLVKRRAPDTVGNVAADVLDNAHENFVRRRSEVAGVVVLDGVNPAEEQVIEAVCGRDGAEWVRGDGELGSRGKKNPPPGAQYMHLQGWPSATLRNHSWAAVLLNLVVKGQIVFSCRGRTGKRQYFKEQRPPNAYRARAASERGR